MTRLTEGVGGLVRSTHALRDTAPVGWTAPNGTRCKVIDPGFTVYEVRILEGDHAGRACFVASEFVKREQ